MRILLINPNSSELMSRAVQREADKWCGPELTVEVITSTLGPEIVSTDAQERQAAAEVVELARRRGGAYDAMIVGCFSDPGLAAARQVVSIPVVGLLEASLAYAAGRGLRYSIVSSEGESDVKLFNQCAAAYGQAALLASVRWLDCGILPALDERGPHLEQTISTCFDQDGAELVIMGCAAFAGIRERLPEALGRRVIDGVAQAIELAAERAAAFKQA